MKLLIQREYIICRWIDNGCTAIIAQWIGLTVLKFSSMLLRPPSRRNVSCSVHAAFVEIKRSSKKHTLHVHLSEKGFMNNYTLWTKHGEPRVVMQDGEGNDDNIADWDHLYEAGAFEDEPMDDVEEMDEVGENTVEDQPPNELGQVLVDS